MKKILSVTVLAVGLMACSGTEAKADSFSITIGDPYFRPYPAYGYYYHPAPVYYSYYEPRRYYYPKPKRYYKHKHRGHHKHGHHGSHRDGRRDGGGHRR